MRALPDKWNLRIWLRDWLTAPSAAEAQQSARLDAAFKAGVGRWRSEMDAKSSTRESTAEQTASTVPRPAAEGPTQCG